jgi:hypothetical protein
MAKVNTGVSPVGMKLRIKVVSAANPKQGLTGLTNATAGLSIAVIKDNESFPAVYTGNYILGIGLPGTYVAPATGCIRFAEVNAQYMRGVYELQLEDERFAGCTSVIVALQQDDGADASAEIQTQDLSANVKQWSGAAASVVPAPVYPPVFTVVPIPGCQIVYDCIFGPNGNPVQGAKAKFVPVNKNNIIDAGIVTMQEVTAATDSDGLFSATLVKGITYAVSHVIANKEFYMNTIVVDDLDTKQLRTYPIK